MSPAWTYDTLTAALQNWPVNSNPSYVAALPRIIGLGELRLVRDLDLEIFETTENASTVAGTRTLTKPAGIFVPKMMQIVDGDRRYPPLRQRTQAFLLAAYPSSAVDDQDRPEMYAEKSTSEWLLGPVPDAAYTVEVTGLARPDSLTSDNPTSWLGTHCPDALFAACLMESEHYLKADDRYADWQKKYASEIIPSTSNELLRLRRLGDLNTYRPAPPPAA